MPTTIALYFSLLAISFLQSEITAYFAELGGKLLGGFALAVVVAVTFAILKLRWRNQNPPAQFISINPRERNDDSAKAAHD